MKCMEILPLHCGHYNRKDRVDFTFDLQLFAGEKTEEPTAKRKNDAIKNRFCEVSQITLLRIRYDQDVNQVLDDFFKTIQND